MKCFDCKREFQKDEFVVEETESGLPLPLIHQECMDPMDWRNAARKSDTILIRWPPNEAYTGQAARGYQADSEHSTRGA